MLVLGALLPRPVKRGSRCPFGLWVVPGLDKRTGGRRDSNLRLTVVSPCSSAQNRHRMEVGDASTAETLTEGVQKPQVRTSPWQVPQPSVLI